MADKRVLPVSYSVDGVYSIEVPCPEHGTFVTLSGRDVPGRLYGYCPRGHSLWTDADFLTLM
jgi:hypothetical protein